MRKQMNQRTNISITEKREKLNIRNLKNKSSGKKQRKSNFHVCTIQKLTNHQSCRVNNIATIQRCTDGDDGAALTNVLSKTLRLN